MQAIAPVGVDELRGPVQELLYKLEVYDGANWINVTELGGSGGDSHLKNVSVSLGGAGMSTSPVAGTWSATIQNDLGIFHPKHPTSPYKNLLRVGREVRISIGGEYGGTPHYWQRLIGFMDAPRFSHAGRTVEISGMDYTSLLANTALRDINPVAVSGSGSGSDEVDSIINGPLHWGRKAEFDAIASPGHLGGELYAAGDACDPVAESNSAAGWHWDTGFGATAGIIQVASPAQESTYSIRMIRTSWGTEQTLVIDNAAPVTAGTSVQISFWARLLALNPNARMMAYVVPTAGLTPIRKIGEVALGLNGNAWTQYSIVGHVEHNGALRLKIYTGGAGALSMIPVEFDQISVKQYATDDWTRYNLPATCNGPYFVTLEGDPVGQGDQGDTLNGEGEGGWHYVEASHSLYFNDAMDIKAGQGTVDIYYYTTQVIENVLADLLVFSGLYANRAAALADLDYVPTGVNIGRVWFDAGSTALAAVAKICERVNYRFWFDPFGKPHFEPAPVAVSITWSFVNPGELSEVAEYQDDKMIRNRVYVEGCQRFMYQVTRDDKASDRFKAEDSDPTSIAAYLEKTYTLSNHLFQGQTVCANMAGQILMEFKDPKWYATLEIFAYPVPLEIGDLISWQVELEPTDFDSGSLEGHESGGVIVDLMGVIRDIKISDSKTSYKVEIADDFWSSGDLFSGVESASASEPVSGSGSTVPEDLCGLDIDGNYTGIEESGSPNEYIFVVPSGVDTIQIECWGPGGRSSAEGGGGGGGAYARTTVPVTPGDTFYLYPCSSIEAPGPAEVYDGSGLICSADHGDDASGVTGGAGGRTGDCVGDISYDGGDGADAQINYGGGGGASAGSTGAGGNANLLHGGVAPADGYNGGHGGPMVGDPGEPGQGPGAGMGGRYPDDGRLPQPGRVRIKCIGTPPSASTPPAGETVEEFYGGDFSSGEFNWDVPYPDGWTSGQTLEVVIECWGCGGPGSPYANAYTAGGGGGGGAYSKVTVNAEPGDYYILRGASQGSGGSVDTYVKDSDEVVICKAERGFYGTDNPTGGIGGRAANGVGDVKYSGGAGANRVSTAVGGGGGASAGPDGDGASASGQTAGAAGTDAGRGGQGGGSDENGEGAPYPNNPVDEMWPGGGGGGQGEDTNGAPVPTPGAGSGSGSRIRITYTL